MQTVQLAVQQALEQVAVHQLQVLASVRMAMTYLRIMMQIMMATATKNEKVTI